MASQVYYDRKSGLNPQASTHIGRKQLPNAEQQLTQKTQKQMKHLAIYALVAYFLFC